MTLTVSDGTASVSETFNWSVVPLGLAAPDHQDSVKGQSVSLALQGRTADGGSLTFTASGLPAGVSVNASTGLITGTPTTLGVYQVGVTASEGTASVSQTFEWDVLQAGLSNPGDQSNQEGDTVSLALHGASGSGASLTDVDLRERAAASGERGSCAGTDGMRFTFDPLAESVPSTTKVVESETSHAGS